MKIQKVEIYDHLPLIEYIEAYKKGYELLTDSQKEEIDMSCSIQSAELRQALISEFDTNS